LEKMSDVVDDESPAKAKTINKYLGSWFTVPASFVRPDEDFAMDWAADDRGNRQVNCDRQSAQRGQERLSCH
jgi:DNA topoisomerase-1